MQDIKLGLRNPAGTAHFMGVQNKTAAPASSPHPDIDSLMMQRALDMAQKAADMGEVPVGAVVVDEDGAILAEAGNNCVAAHDPAGHAEIRALRAAAQKTGNYRLPGATVYVTLEPCAMCASAMIHARIKRLVFGAPDPKTGAIHSLYQIGSDQRLNHVFLVTSGILADECGGVLKKFFQKRRKK